MPPRSDTATEPLRVLFLCTGNSCRSQMAEGLCNAMHAGTIVSQSAGTKPGVLNRRAVRAMAEIGIDISAHASKHVNTLIAEPFDAIITVCDSANEACPTIPGAKRIIHMPFDDPPRLAPETVPDDEAMPHYRRVRDEIKICIQSLPAILAAR